MITCFYDNNHTLFEIKSERTKGIYEKSLWSLYNNNFKMYEIHSPKTLEAASIDATVFADFSNRKVINSFRFIKIYIDRLAGKLLDYWQLKYGNCTIELNPKEHPFIFKGKSKSKLMPPRR